MARRRYRITDEDALSAWRWIHGKLDGIGNWPVEDGDLHGWDRHHEALEAFRALDDWNDAEGLNAWAEQWLDRGQWTQLKNVVRAQRKRRRDRGDRERKPVTITISRRAHRILQAITNRDRVTYSEVIERYLDDGRMYR